jgi:hypothetical protein
MNITQEEAQDLVEWMEIAWDEGQGPEPWEFLARLKAAFPTLYVSPWFHEQDEEPVPVKPEGCLCSMPLGKHTDICPHYDYPVGGGG